MYKGLGERIRIRLKMGSSLWHVSDEGGIIVLR